MASTSSSVGFVQSHTCCPARVAKCFCGRLCPYRKHHGCWFGNDDDLEEDPPCRDVAATSCRVDAATASDLVVRVRRLERIVEQIGGLLVPQFLKGDVDRFQENSVGEQIGAAPVPQIWEPVGEVVQLVPRERVQNRTPEQILDSPVPQIMEAVWPSTPRERVQNRTPEHVMDSSVPQVLEAVLPSAPQERVQNCTLEQIAAFPVPQISEAFAGIVRASPQESVQHRIPDPIVDLPVPRIMDAAVEVVRDTPLERVLNRTPEPIVDVPVPHIKEDGLLLMPQEHVHNRVTYTGKVFTVRLHRDDHASTWRRDGATAPDHKGLSGPCGC